MLLRRYKDRLIHPVAEVKAEATVEEKPRKRKKKTDQGED